MRGAQHAGGLNCQFRNSSHHFYAHTGLNIRILQWIFLRIGFLTCFFFLYSVHPSHEFVNYDLKSKSSLKNTWSWEMGSFLVKVYLSAFPAICTWLELSCRGSRTPLLSTSHTHSTSPRLETGQQSSCQHPWPPVYRNGIGWSVHEIKMGSDLE